MDCVFSSPGANKVRVIAIICIVVGILQLAFSASANAVFDGEGAIGSWWCGLAILLTCIFTGLKATNLCSVVCAIIFGVISIILAIVACFIDSVLSAHFNELEGCVSVSDGTLYGDNTDEAVICASYYSTASCVCVDYSYFGSYSCYDYNINDDYDCGYILDEVPSNLGLSALFAGISVVTMIVFSCIACSVTCCPNSCGHYDPNYVQPGAAQQQGVPVVVVQGQPPQYVQGQVQYQHNPQMQQGVPAMNKQDSAL